MRKPRGRGRPKQSDKFRVRAVLRETVDMEKLTQAVILLAKDIAENKDAYFPYKSR